MPLTGESLGRLCEVFTQPLLLFDARQEQLPALLQFLYSLTVEFVLKNSYNFFAVPCVGALWQALGGENFTLENTYNHASHITRHASHVPWTHLQHA